MKYVMSIALLLSNQSLFPMLTCPVGLMRAVLPIVGKRSLFTLEERAALIEKAHTEYIPVLEELDRQIAAEAKLKKKLIEEAKGNNTDLNADVTED